MLSVDHSGHQQSPTEPAIGRPVSAEPQRPVGAAWRRTALTPSEVSHENDATVLSIVRPSIGGMRPSKRTCQGVMACATERQLEAKRHLAASFGACRGHSTVATPCLYTRSCVQGPTCHISPRARVRLARARHSGAVSACVGCLTGRGAA